MRLSLRLLIGMSTVTLIVARRSNAGVVAYADLFGAAAIVAIGVLWIGRGEPPTSVLVMLGGLLLFAIPGYAMTIAVFPYGDRGRREADDRNGPGWGDGTVDAFERLVLSVGLSVVSLPILGVLLALSPFELSQASAVGIVGVVTGVTILIAAIRRYRTVPSDRFLPSVSNRMSGKSASVAVSITLLITVLIAVGVLGFTVAMPQDGESTTELYVLSADGDPVAAEYPESVEAGEPVALDVGVQNDEHETVDFSLVVIIEQTVDADATSVSDVDELTRTEITLEDGEEWQETLEFVPPETGEDQRVSVLLYQDEPHFFLDQRTAYRHVHIWLDVTE